MKNEVSRAHAVFYTMSNLWLDLGSMTLESINEAIWPRPEEKMSSREYARKCDAQIDAYSQQHMNGTVTLISPCNGVVRAFQAYNK